MPLASQNLSGGYERQLIVKQVNLNLQTGEWLSLLGANGSGKSTFLKLLCRILKPFQGKVLLDGKAIHSLPPPVVARKIAILPQQQIVPAGITVEQLVSLGRTPHQPWYQWDLSAEDKEQVAIAIQETQLESFRHRPVEQLSGGERQRAFLALALAQNPQVLLLDEPTTYLDINYQLQLLELLKNLNKQGLTIITVLHEINLAVRYSHRLALLKSGQLYIIGDVPTVLTPENLAQVFGVEVAVIDTPVGLQICPISC
ncbi:MULTISPECIES: ABC transporter ATP-binding protein [Cyanophyceae]|uniref:ABC transporter ATP-binding protein n=1 Tax=Cyanophyceae TaxID=3028117 RepID=UPI000B4A4FAA|nr:MULTISPECIES: ABC transporter ATP-binding protein [Cyanophyceae]NQZ65044.1 ABC transporter ATP-binding protein [Crocosphaera sp.]